MVFSVLILPCQDPFDIPPDAIIWCTLAVLLDIEKKPARYRMTACSRAIRQPARSTVMKIRTACTGAV